MKVCDSLVNLSGVYKITCKPTGKIYIGSAFNFRKRWINHRYDLRKQKHDSKYMQNSWNKYGEDAFDFEILVVCDKSNVLVYEQIFLDALNPDFNTCKIAGNNAGVRMSEEAKENMRKIQRDKRRKHLYNGQLMCLSEICEIHDIPLITMMQRVSSGKSIEQAVEMGAPKRNPLYEYQGRQEILSVWAKEFNVAVYRLAFQLKRGYTVQEAIDKIQARDLLAKTKEVL